MKTIIKSLILIALAMSSFIACSSSNGETIVEDTNTTSKFIINTLENKDISLDASLLAQTKDTKVKITRDVESDIMNVYVIRGSVEVTQIVSN